MRQQLLTRSVRRDGQACAYYSMGDPLRCSSSLWWRKEVGKENAKEFVISNCEVVSSWVSSLKHDGRVLWTWARYLSSTSTGEFTRTAKREEARFHQTLGQDASETWRKSRTTPKMEARQTLFTMSERCPMFQVTHAWRCRASRWRRFDRVL